MKVKLKKKRIHRYDVNMPWSRHGNKYSKYKKCLSRCLYVSSST